MDRKRYMAEVYPRYWLTAREKIYGFPEYDRNLCRFISGRTPKGAKLLEVAVGTGYPFADYFQKAGYEVSGVDISAELVKKCLELNPNIHAKLGDAEALDYPHGAFDCVYCFHSTWYFPDVRRAVSEMIRVTRPGGLIVFDVQNLNHAGIGATYRRKHRQTTALGTTVRYAKNLAKLVLRRGEVSWSYVLYEVPTRPEELYQQLASADVSSWQVMARRGDDSLEEKPERGSLGAFARLVFAISH